MSSGWPPEEDGSRWEPVRHPSAVGAAHDSRDAARGYSGYAYYAPEEGANGGLAHDRYEVPGYGQDHGYGGANGYEGIPGYDGADWTAPAPRSPDGSGGYAVGHFSDAAPYDTPEDLNGPGEQDGPEYHGEIGYGDPGQHDERQGYVDVSGAPGYAGAGYGNTGYEVDLYAQPRYDDAGYQDSGYEGAGYPGRDPGEGHDTGSDGRASGYDGQASGYDGGQPGYAQDYREAQGYQEDRGYQEDQGYQEEAYGQNGYAPDGYVGQQDGYAQDGYSANGSGEYAARDGDYGPAGYGDDSVYGQDHAPNGPAGYADAGYAASYLTQGYGNRDYGDPRYDDPGYGDPGYGDAQYSGPSYPDQGHDDASYQGAGYGQNGYGAPAGEPAAAYGAPVYTGEDLAPSYTDTDPAQAVPADGYGAEGYGADGYGSVPGYEAGYDQGTGNGQPLQPRFIPNDDYDAGGYPALEAASGPGRMQPGQMRPDQTRNGGAAPDYVPAGFAPDEFDAAGGMLGETPASVPDPAATGRMSTAGMLDATGLAGASDFADRAALPAASGFLEASGPMRALGGTGVFDSAEFPAVQGLDSGQVSGVRESDVAELFGDAPPAETTSLDLPADAPGDGKTGRLTRPKAGRAPAKPVGRRRGASGDRRLWLALGGVGAAAAVAIAAIVLVGFKGGPSGPAHALGTPNKIGSFVRRPALEQQMNVDQLRKDVVNMSSGQASHVVEAVYENGTSTTGQTPQIVLFIGGNLANASPADSVKSFTQRFKGAKIAGPGSLGGDAACVNATASEPGSVAMCAWFDNDSFGEVVSPTMNASALATTMRQIRPDVEKVVPKKQ